MSTLLIVDDNQQNQYMLQVLLSANGYQVEMASNGAEALEQARRAPPDMIISDILMPVMDGFSLCRAWKEDERLKDIPFIFYTDTYTDSKDKDFALSLGADRFIIKPAEPDKFLALLLETRGNFEAGKPVAPRQPLKEAEYYQGYNTALICKLEDKMLQLEEANRILEGNIAERKRAMDETWALLNATRAVVEESEFEKAARRVFDICRDLLGARAGYIALLSANEQKHKLLSFDPGELFCSTDPSLLMPLQGLRSQAFKLGRTVYDNNFLISEPSKLTTEGTDRSTSVMFTPLRVEGETMGLVGLAGKTGGFTGEDARLTEAFGELMAIALQRSIITESLKTSEEKFRVIFEGVRDGIALADAETRRFVSANPAFCALLGYTADEIFNLGVDDIHPRQDLPSVIEVFEKQTKGELGLVTDIPVKRKDGSVFYADVNSTPIEFSGKKYLVGCFRDMTEKRKLQASLTQSDRLASMGMLAAGVAHEINNPLSYILFILECLRDELPGLAILARQGNTALVGEGAAGPPADRPTAIDPTAIEDLARRTKDALDGSYRIRDIVKGLGTFARVEPTDVTEVDLPYVIDCAVNMAYNEIKYRARLVKEYGKTPAIRASEGRLSQVFLNLLINAAHAIEEGAVESNEILIRTWAEGGDVFAEVRDTGKGVPPEHINRVFKPFFTTKAVGIGSGLGLAICRNIITGFGGEIGVESEAGRGSRFWIRLPVGEKAEAKPEEAAQAEPVGPAVHGRVLVVDDEAVIRSMVARLLKDHDVVTTGSGEEAKAILEQDQRFDLILCDLMMPKISGIDLHHWLTETIPELASKIVFFTGGAFTPRTQEYLSKVDNLQVQKPFDTVNLRKLVGKLVQDTQSRAGGKDGI